MNGILKPCRTIVRTHSLSVNSSHIVPQSESIVLPLECPEVAVHAVERAGFQNFVEEEAGLEEGNCLTLPVLLVKSFY